MNERNAQVHPIFRAFVNSLRHFADQVAPVIEEEQADIERREAEATEAALRG